jgi:hypothetical protein
LNHAITDCVDSQIVQGGCPLEKCKLKKDVKIKDLRIHFNEECTKIDMQCSNCKERFRRPFAKLHDCSDVYEARLKQEKEDHEVLLKQEKDMLEASLKQERDWLADAQRIIAM